MSKLSKDEVLIEKAKSSDAKELLEIYAPYIKKTAITFEYDIPSVEEFAQRIDEVNKTYPYLKAVYNGQIIGYTYVHRYRPRKAYDFAVETSIYVHEDYRQSGVGKMLYDSIESLLAKQGILNLVALIALPKGDDPFLTLDSVKFHEKMGYKKCGTLHSIGKKFGRWYDLLLMEKSLGKHENDDAVANDKLKMLPSKICGMNFAPFPSKGTFEDARTYESLDTMISRTNTNMVILTPFGLMDTAQSQSISIDNTVTDDELIRMIEYIHSKGAMVAIKPTVNCKNGTWRGHIAFFENDIVCEPKWGPFFGEYSKFQCHYARIAHEYNCEMVIAGCEMVMSDHRDFEWRKVISDIRKCYDGIISYNADKYQEDSVTWWDAVDIISSSGYYPVTDWDNQIDRIRKVVENFNKPFFFAECGCMSSKGSWNVPNDWGLIGESALEEQAKWYQAMFEAINKSGFVMGTGLWSWAPFLYDESKINEIVDYELYLKPAEKIVCTQYAEWNS